MTMNKAKWFLLLFQMAWGTPAVEDQVARDVWLTPAPWFDVVPAVWARVLAGDIHEAGQRCDRVFRFQGREVERLVPNLIRVNQLADLTGLPSRRLQLWLTGQAVAPVPVPPPADAAAGQWFRGDLQRWAIQCGGRLPRGMIICPTMNEHQALTAAFGWSGRALGRVG
jgi:hypothetical protein